MQKTNGRDKKRRRSDDIDNRFSAVRRDLFGARTDAKNALDRLTAASRLVSVAPPRNVRLLRYLGGGRWNDVTGPTHALLNENLRVLTFNVWFAQTSRRGRFDGFMDLLFGAWKVDDDDDEFILN